MKRIVAVLPALLVMALATACACRAQGQPAEAPAAQPAPTPPVAPAPPAPSAAPAPPASAAAPAPVPAKKPAAAGAPGQRCVQHSTQASALNEVNVELKSSARATGADLVSASYFMPAGAQFKVAINDQFDPAQRYFAYVEPFVPPTDPKYLKTVNMDGFIESAAIGATRIADDDALVKGNLVESGSTLLTLNVPYSIGGFWRPAELYVWTCAGDVVGSRSILTARAVSWYAAGLVIWPLVFLLYFLAAIATKTADIKTDVPLFRYFDPVYLTAGSDGKGSLSKLQILFFSLIVFGLLSYILARTGALSDLSSSILYLLGIAGVGSAVAKGTDEQKNRLSLDNRAWLVGKTWLPEAGWAAVNTANWHDIITNDGGEFDVYRYQSCIFSLTVGGALLVTGVNELASFAIPQTLLGILGLSQAVYIGGKAVSTSAVAELNDAITSVRAAEKSYADALAKPSTDADAAASLTKSTLIDYENSAKYAKGLFETLTDRHITDDQLKPSVTA